LPSTGLYPLYCFIMDSAAKIMVFITGDFCSILLQNIGTMLFGIEASTECVLGVSRYASKSNIYRIYTFKFIVEAFIWTHITLMHTSHFKILNRRRLNSMAKFTVLGKRKGGEVRYLYVAVGFVVGLDVVADDASPSDLLADEEPESHLCAD